MEITYIIIASVAILAILLFLLRNVIFSSKMDTVFKHLKQKDYNEATKILKQMIQKNDRNEKAHFYLGDTYFLQDNFEWALPHFRKVLSINKFTSDVSEVKVRERLAEIFLHFSQPEEAQKELLMILKLKPDQYFYYFRVGEIFYQRHYTDNAANYFKKALELNPSHVESLFYLGELHYTNKHYTECLQEMKNILKVNPQFHRAHYYIGMVYILSKNYLQAIQEFEKSIVDADYRIRSFWQKGKALLDSGHPDKGILELERGVQYITGEDSSSLGLRYLLANTYEKVRDITSAIEQWEVIASVNPKYQDVQKKLQDYKDVRMDDRLKDFMTASDSRFEIMCSQLVNNLGLEVQEMKISRGNMATIISSEKESEWRNARRAKQLIKIFRTNEKIGDTKIREILDEMKEIGAVKVFLITADEFSRQGIEYAESRPIQLYDKNQLSTLFKSGSTD